jgi:hypothetical protein
MDASVGAYQSGLAPLQPTVAGRTLDVSAGGEAGIDWANIGSPTTTVVFSGTTINTITNYTGNTPQTGDAYAYLVANMGLLGVNLTAADDAVMSRLGAPSGASVSADIAAAKADTAAVYTATIAATGVAVAASPSPTTTSFGSNSTAASGWWDDAKVTFTTGPLAGVTRVVSSFANTNGVFSFDEAWPSAPSAGETFTILRDHVHPTSQIASAVRTELATELARIDVATSTRLATAGYSAPLDAAGVRSAVGLSSANLDTQLGAIQSDATAILDDTSTSGVVVAAASKSGYALSAGGLALVLVDGKTVPQALQIIGAIVAGKISGAGSGTEIFVGLDGATTRATVTVDGDGNRSNVVYV